MRRVFEGDFRHQTLQNIGYSLCSRISARHQIILAATVLVLAPIFIFASRYPPSSLSQTPKMDWGEKLSPSALSGTLDFIQETQVVWQIPSSPKAVLFIAHGCHCRATFFWDKGPKCAECVGLPEERILVLHALMKGYAIVAISSTRECWGIPADKSKVQTILSSWINEKGLERLPVVALGASSGGNFISALAREYKFNSLVVMISEGIFKIMRIEEDYPPTLFVHMPKDKRRALLIKQAMDLLKNKGIQTTEVKCYELPVTPHFFTKIQGLDTVTSEKIYRVLKDNGILDDQDCMTGDGRSLNWLMPLKGQQLMPEESFKKWEMHLQELLNLAYGYHEMTSLQSDAIFEWFDAHLPETGNLS